MSTNVTNRRAMADVRRNAKVMLPIGGDDHEPTTWLVRWPSESTVEVWGREFRTALPAGETEATGYLVRLGVYQHIDDARASVAAATEA